MTVTGIDTVTQGDQADNAEQARGSLSFRRLCSAAAHDHTWRYFSQNSRPHGAVDAGLCIIECLCVAYLWQIL